MIQLQLLLFLEWRPSAVVSSIHFNPLEACSCKWILLHKEVEIGLWIVQCLRCIADDANNHASANLWRSYWDWSVNWRKSRIIGTFFWQIVHLFWQWVWGDDGEISRIREPTVADWLQIIGDAPSIMSLHEHLSKKAKKGHHTGLAPQTVCICTPAIDVQLA